MKKIKEGQPQRKVSWEEINGLIRQMMDEIPEGATVWGIPTNGSIIAERIALTGKNIKASIAKEPEHWMIVVDDIHDSGETATPYHESGNTVMTLYSRSIEGKKDADFFVEQVFGDEWLVFPWEK